jgi:glycine cleavage system H protein
MSDTIPSDLKYAASHEWVRDEGDGTVTLGISHHAQALLGDIVFVELPEKDDDLDAGDDCGVIESVKAASDMYTPVAGTVIATNDALDGEPELVNSAPYTDGWVCKMRLADDANLEGLMDAAAYTKVLEDEEH